ncbi:MAG TPA: hypothetical protein VJP84_07900 [Steroidobacteraceae bacterium]|jgi:hypothetical protein|nr:hypothetical protein [Steroidobacteraceae bacterium]
MSHKQPKRPTLEDLHREFERTRVQIREVEQPARRPHLPSFPLDREPGEAPPPGPTVH